MSLCYDIQKWTIMTMLAILTVCLVGMVNLVFGQSQYWYVAPNGTMYKKDKEANETQKQATEKQRELERDKYRKMIEEDIKKGGRNESQIQESMIKQEMMQTVKKQLEAIVNFCFEHADRPNPILDLIDKGFLSELTWKNETCKSVKQQYDTLQGVGE
jgi:hypothetical protein